jgi:uncharacterized protein YceH (UPF0502 family)
MSEAESTGKTPQTQSWPVLEANERRVLGVLVEKSKTTPDSYPLSLNALTAGCNQKSARDPVMNLTDLDVEDTLTRLQKRGLVLKVTSSRVDRWRHQLYDTWHLDRVDLALITELLLRGPQTEGELRTRAGRMEPFDDIEALRKAVKPLAERGLVVYLTPQGRRGTALTHGFHPPEELDRLKKRFGAGVDTDEASPPVAAAIPPEWEQRLTEAHAEVARLRQEVEGFRGTIAELTQKLATLTAQVQELRQGLGL